MAVLERLANTIKQVLHLIGGFIDGLLFPIHPVYATVIAMMFVIYELNEDKHIHDGAYRDIVWFLVGLYMAAPLVITASVLAKIYG